MYSKPLVGLSGYIELVRIKAKVSNTNTHRAEGPHLRLCAPEPLEEVAGINYHFFNVNKSQWVHLSRSKKIRGVSVYDPYLQGRGPHQTHLNRVVFGPYLRPQWTKYQVMHHFGIRTTRPFR